MSLDFTSPRAALERQRHRRLDREAQGLPLIRRLDPALLVLIGFLSVSFLAFWSISVITGWRVGFFDPPLMRSLPDERVLTNLRDDLTERPLLASALHQDRLYVSQTGGDLHRFDPKTELWTSESIGQSQFFGDLVDLRSRARGLWARSAQGGLARLQDGQWSTIFSESTFMGSAGISPSTDDLTTAALSDEGRWLLLGTREQGVGLLDEQRQEWVSLKTLLEVLPSPVVTHLRWWKDRFWIGGPQGLAFLIPDVQTPRIGVRSDLSGTITDLDAGDALWILEARDCTNELPGDQRCTRLSRLTEPDALPQPLVDERHRYPELDLASVTVVQQQDEILVVAGKAGLFSYDLRLHSWNRHWDRPVLAHWREKGNGGSLYVGTTAGVAHFAAGRLQRQWPFSGESGQRVRRIAPAGGGEMLAFTDERNIWSLPPNGEARAVFTSTWSKSNPRDFSAAMVLENGQVLFRGAGGLMVHDALKRSYEDLSRHQLPAWLFDPLARFEASGQRLFGFLPPIRGRHSVVVTDVSQMARGGFDEPGRVPTPIEVTAPWANQDLAVLAGDGSAYLVGEHTVNRMTGAAVEDLMDVTWNDVALDNERLAVATEKGLRVYRQDSRSWQPWILPGVAIRGVVASGGEIRMLTHDGRLAQPEADNPFLIGGEHQDWRLPRAGLTDALMAEGQIYLAGGGQVHRYDPKRRRINWQWLVGWSPDRAGDQIETRLIDVVGVGNRAQPLSWVGDLAYLGATKIDPEAGRVVGLSLGDRYIWTVREKTVGGPRYLKGYSRDQPFEPGRMRCLFRHSSAGGGQPMDVRQIRPGLLAVATGEGLKLYSRDARSWYDVHWRDRPLLSDLPGASQEEVLFHLGDSLALWTRGEKSGTLAEAQAGRLQVVDMDDLEIPSSCSDRSSIDVDIQLTIQARDIAFQEKQAVWIDQDGAVKKWSDGDLTTLLASPKLGPDSRDLRRAFRFEDYLIFTAEASLYVYHLAHHTWSSYPVALPNHQAGAITDIAVEGSTIPWTVTVSTASGAVFAGTLDPKGLWRDGSVADGSRDSGAPDKKLERPLQLREVLSARARRRGSLGADPKDLLDVQWRVSKWAFVLPDRLVVFDPEARRWLPPIVFPGPPDTTLSLRQAAGVDVLIKSQGREWWIEQERDAISGRVDTRFALFEPTDDLATAIDQSSRVWRLRKSGRVERCRASAGAYSCQVVIAADLTDPIAAFEQGPGGVGLLARRRSALGKSLQSTAKEALTTLTGQRAEIEPRLPPAVDAGWLAWRRDTGTFRLVTSSGAQTFSRQQLFDGKNLIFEDVRAVLAQSPFRLHAATPHGVWTFRRGSLSLERQEGSIGRTTSAASAASARVVFTPVALGREVRGAHGRFLTPRLSYEISRASLESGAYTEHKIQIGVQVTLVAHTREHKVSGTIEAPGRTASAFSSAGFAWDRRDQIIAHPDRGLLLSSRAGVHPLDLEQGGAGFDLRPDSPASAETSSLSRDQILVDTPFWSWIRREGSLQAQAKNPITRLKLRRETDGWRLTSDRLWAATFHDQHLHLLTEASHEELTESLKARDSLARAPFETDLLESLRPRPDEPAMLFARAASRQSGTSWNRWDPEAGTFQAATTEEDPRQNRERVLHGRLRLRLRGGRVVGDLRVEDPDTSQARWKSFQLGTRGFPFDQITALGGVEGHFLLSTPVGLQVYRAGGGKGLDDPRAIFDLPAPDARIGRPLEDPSRLLVVTPDACFEWQDQRLIRCSRQESLDQRFRGENDLWRFTAEKGRPRGFYKDFDGRVTTTEVQLRGGRLPHDHLRDLTHCDGATASLWRNGWLSLHEGSNLSLTSSQNHGAIANQNLQRLLCVKQPRLVAPASTGAAAPSLAATPSLAKGLYGAAGQRYWHWNGETWNVVTDPRLRNALASPPLQQYGRLRLIRRPRSGFVYQIQTADGPWSDLPWLSQEGRLSIDVIDDVQVDGDTLWTRTAAGIVPFRRGQDGTLRLLTQELSVISPPQVDGRPCTMTDFALAEGRAIVRCDFDSRKVFERELRLDPKEGFKEGPEKGLEKGLEKGGLKGFRRHTGRDPFAESHFVTAEASGFWDWRWLDRRGGRPGVMEARFRGEPLGLSQGRFDFDHLTSLTLMQQVELTSAVGGWYRHPGEGLHVRDLIRPAVTGQVRPENVVRIGLSHVANEGPPSSGGPSALRLCVTTTEDTAFLVTEDTVVGSATQCVEHLGQAGLWTYDQPGGRLRIRAPGVKGGWARRTLDQGRFADQVALGPPAHSAEPNLDDLIPTAAGVVRVDAAGKAVVVHAPEHEGLEPGQVPVVLFLTSEGRGDYVTPTDVRSLETGAVVSTNSFRLPDGARAIALENSSTDLLRLFWQQDGEHGWTLLRADTYAAVGDQVLTLDAGNWPRFQLGRIAWGSPSAGFGLRLLAQDAAAEKLELFTADGERTFTLPWRAGQSPIDLVPLGPRLYVIQPGEISELRLDVGIERLFE